MSKSRWSRRVLGLALGAAAGGGLGCDNNSGGTNGASIPHAPTTMLGKAVKAGKDTQTKLSEGGDSREAVVLNSKIKLEQMGETITALRARVRGESSEQAVADAEKKHKKAVQMAEKMQESTSADDGTEVKMLRDAVKDVQTAIDRAKDVLGG